MHAAGWLQNGSVRGMSGPIPSREGVQSLSSHPHEWHPLLLLHLDSAREREISAFHRNLIQRSQECTFDTRGARNWSTRSRLPRRGTTLGRLLCRRPDQTRSGANGKVDHFVARRETRLFTADGDLLSEGSSDSESGGLLEAARKDGVGLLPG